VSLSNGAQAAPGLSIVEGLRGSLFFVLLIALRQIPEAPGGVAKVAKAAGVERESL